MKQNILKKLLVSGAAALGIMGLSTPAAFAWSGSSGYGGYNNSYNNSNSSQMSYSKVQYTSYTSYTAESYSSSYNNNSYGNSNEYGGRNNCPHIYVSHRHKGCDHQYGNSYQTSQYD